MTRGTWQGSGTFQTGGGAENMAYCLVAGVLVVAGASWVLRHMLWIAVPAGVVLAAAVAGTVWWLLGAAKRKARYADAYAAAFARHREARTMTATVTPQVMRGAVPAVENHVHYHVRVGDAAAARPACPWPAREEIAP